MTEQQILELAKTCEFDRHISKTTNDIYWECDEEDLLKFAQEIYKKAYSTGHRDGFDDGYESAKVSTEMNTWSSDND
ncbi:Hypothetical-Protein / belonging to T4-LIKE GC: 787 [Synechococcus phage S-PM2]|uniref:Hypothetical-Protein belonging to T4-LIKE GC: 787 n=1 Tax=Synechococcus phage S-PM2 TaxID=238854 RepID=Q5GQP6_BPSYP|nr:Hypothetical-Protein / belonging to T4-LIKE GC: 787 [Synechococcus phage S-PM2]CAF34106.2 Hypothetical-Protein / belonging to T4-LIKE GC: 787 [Synechococcus phage S-PM2]